MVFNQQVRRANQCRAAFTRRSFSVGGPTARLASARAEAEAIRPGINFQFTIINDLIFKLKKTVSK
jgi:hypothetical protein